MDARNDGRIPGGPTTQAIIQERQTHISSVVWSGEAYDYDAVKLRGHGEWRHGWELTPQQKYLIDTFGFSYVDSILIKRHNRDLILSLVERWWPGRNTFQLPVGEMTITLADVSMILGLAINGSPIYFEEGLKGDYLIRRYLGMEPPANHGESLTIKMTWLRENFMYVDLIGDRTIPVDDFRVICCTRAYLLSLCGAFLFPDGSGNKVNLSLLPYLEDLGSFTKHAWGAAVLAYLYSSMSTFVRLRPGARLHPNVSGCITLIQLWCHEHFDIGAFRYRSISISVETVAELSQDPAVDPRLLLDTSVQYLSQPFRPPILPLHPTEDHPVGIVRRRPARPKRGRGIDRQAGEGTSRAGEGTSRAGEGTSRAGEGTSRAGEETSQPGGSEWDYYTQIMATNSPDVFGSPQFDPASQIFVTPTGPVQTQETHESDPWEPLPGERPEDTAERRNRLGLRPRPRRYYDRMARGRE